MSRDAEVGQAAQGLVLMRDETQTLSRPAHLAGLLYGLNGRDTHEEEFDSFDDEGEDSGGESRSGAKRRQSHSAAASASKRAATSSPGSDAAYEGGATSACRVCGGPPKTYKDYCKSCYGVLYKHIKQIIEIIHRNGSKFNTAGTRQATLKRLKDAAGSARQRSHASCKGKCSPEAYHHSTPARRKCARCRVLACIELLPDLALQLLRMHLTKAVALAEKTVNIYSMPDASSAGAAPASAASSASGTGCPAQTTGCLSKATAQLVDCVSATAKSLPSLQKLIQDHDLVPQAVMTPNGPIVVLLPSKAVSKSAASHAQGLASRLDRTRPEAASSSRAAQEGGDEHALRGAVANVPAPQSSHL